MVYVDDVICYWGDVIMKTLIKNGRVVTAVDDYRADILIEAGTKSYIG